MSTQVEQLKQMFFQLGSVVELLSIAGYHTGPLDENQTRAAALCACTVVDEVAVQLHALTEELEQTS